MLPERLDRYQSKAKTNLQEHSEILIYGPRDAGKAYFIRNTIVNYLQQGKKVLFLAKDRQSIQSAVTLFRSQGLSGSLLFYEPAKSIGRDLKNELLKKIKSARETSAFLDYDRLLLEASASHEKVVKYYGQLNSRLIYGKPWHELLVLQAFDKHSTSLLHYNHLLAPTGYRFEQEEYDTLMHAIKKAYALVEKDEAYTDQVFISEVYQKEQADDAWKEMAKWIAESRKKMGSLLLSLNKYLDNLAKGERKLFLAEIGAVKKELEEIDLEARKLESSINLLKAHENRKMNSSLKTLQKENKTKQGQLLERLNSCLDQIWMGEKSIYGSLALPSLGAQEGIESIRKTTGGLLKQIDSIGAMMALHVRQKLDALNSNQAKDPKLSKLDEEVEHFYRWLKERKLVHQNFENTAFSVNKKLLQLKELLATFNFFESREGEFKRYFSWNAFYYGQEELVRKLIDVLLIIRPLDWIAFFRNWYLQNALQYNKSLFDKNVDAELDTLQKTWQEMGKVLPEYIRNKKSLEIVGFLEDKSRKSEISELKKKLGQKKEELNWLELFRAHPEFILYNYPLFLTEAKNLNELSIGHWDLIVLKDLFGDLSKGENAKHLQNMGGKRLWSQTTEKAENWDDQEKIKQVYMKGLHQQNIIPLSEMNHTEKLYAARNLAYLLEDINSGVVVYRMDEYIIFSCLSKPLNQVMEQLLDKRGIKKMRILESPFHLLVENLLEVKLKQVLIAQDGLINNYQADRIAWQLFVKERFKKAGVAVVDFKSDILLANPVQAIFRFTELHFPKKEVSAQEKDQNLNPSD
jgi:hypothetical protein